MSELFHVHQTFTDCERYVDISARCNCKLQEVFSFNCTFVNLIFIMHIHIRLFKNFWDKSSDFLLIFDLYHILLNAILHLIIFKLIDCTIKKNLRISNSVIKNLTSTGQIKLIFGSKCLSKLKLKINRFFEENKYV